MAVAAATRTFGRQVRSLRHRSGLSLRALARDAGISHAYLSLVERGEVAAPSDNVVHALAQSLDVDPANLFAVVGRLPPRVRVYLTDAGLAAALVAAVDAGVPPAALSAAVNRLTRRTKP